MEVGVDSAILIVSLFFNFKHFIRCSYFHSRSASLNSMVYMVIYVTLDAEID